MWDTQISALLSSPTVSGGFARQVFITTRTLPFFSAENVALHLPLEAAATQERRLEAVRCSTWFGAGVTATRGLLLLPRSCPPTPLAECSGCGGTGSSDRTCSSGPRAARNSPRRPL